jgi:hypothetical protein
MLSKCGVVRIGVGIGACVIPEEDHEVRDILAKVAALARVTDDRGSEGGDYVSFAETVFFHLSGHNELWISDTRKKDTFSKVELAFRGLQAAVASLEPSDQAILRQAMCKAFDRMPPELLLGGDNITRSEVSVRMGWQWWPRGRHDRAHDRRRQGNLAGNFLVHIPSGLLVNALWNQWTENISLALSGLTGSNPWAEPARQRGRRKGSVANWRLQLLVKQLFGAAADYGGELTADHTREDGGTMIQALELLRPLLPDGVVPKVMPVSTIEKVIRDYIAEGHQPGHLIRGASSPKQFPKSEG